jgi:hypothetical protein
MPARFGRHHDSSEDTQAAMDEFFFGARDQLVG